MSPKAVASLTGIAAGWVRDHPELRALAIVGSWARGDAQAESDLDLLVLAADRHGCVTDPFGVRGLDFSKSGHRVTARQIVQYGAVRSHHIGLWPTAELELSFAPTTWAMTDPIDAGTAEVIRGGCRIIVDKDGLFRDLLAAVEG